MKKLVVLALVLFIFPNAFAHMNDNTHPRVNEIGVDFPIQKKVNQKIKIDGAIISAFFKKYPAFKKYKSNISILYKKRNYKSIWHDGQGIIEFANLLYSKVTLLENEGLKLSLPYKDKIDTIFDGENKDNLSPTETELLLSAMYVFYAKKVFHGIDENKTQEIGWFIPRKSISYENLLDSLLIDPKRLNKNENQLFKQYYMLRDILIKYRKMEQTGNWKPISTDSIFKDLKPKDSSKTIGQIRHRLAVIGDLQNDSKSNWYDDELKTALLNYKIRNGFNLDYNIEYKHIERLNIPIEQYIKTIIVNMERCRWIDPKLAQADEFVLINIPAFKLFYKKNGKTELESKLFVGKLMNETVVFSSSIEKIIFSPYWTIPKSIVDYELKYEIERDENYLTKHNIELKNGIAIQKPGPNNSLGLVKFIFPNTNSIYLHDTPAKNLFEFEYRAFSHGCINIQSAKELAGIILKTDSNWPIDRINDAMNGGIEKVCVLKKKIPIHIGYFTSWVNDSGEINFYPDIYSRDNRLYELLFSDESK